MKLLRLTMLAALAAVALAAAPLWLPPAMSQEDMKEILAPAFGKHTRPPAVFVHDAHNEKAKLDDCAACHHGKDANGKQTVEETSEGEPCSECHAVNASPGTPLMRAYHQQCIGCHQTSSAGPIHCGGCHQL